jgi:NTP pyrophosphatase (non-canonical NTP hydrolase)
LRGGRTLSPALSLTYREREVALGLTALVGNVAEYREREDVAIILAMTTEALTISAFQKHILDRYAAVDRARGWPKTFAYFIEEVGELATALAADGTDKGDRANLEEEFADVVAWLCTLANITDVDLATAIRNKYLGPERPEGHK